MAMPEEELDERYGSLSDPRKELEELMRLLDQHGGAAPAHPQGGLAFDDIMNMWLQGKNEDELARFPLRQFRMMNDVPKGDLDPNMEYDPSEIMGSLNNARELRELGLWDLDKP